MGKYRKYYKNLFNEKTYLKNIGNVKVVKDTESLTPVYDDVSNDEKLQEIFVDNKKRNRDVYCKTRASYHLQKFVLFFVPVILAVSTGFAWFAPVEEKTKKFDKVEITSTKLMNGEVIDSSKNAQYIDKFEYDFTDEFKKFPYNSVESEVIYYVYNQDEGAKIRFKVNDDNTLTVESVDFGKKELTAKNEDSIFSNDFNNYESSNKVEVKNQNEYVHLFDDILDYLKNTKDIKKSALEKIRMLTDQEKKDIVIYFVERQDVGEADVNIRSHHVLWRMFLSLSSGIYLLIMLMSGFSPYKNWSQMENYYGSLREDYNSKTLYNLSLKHKKTLELAENERIKKSINEAKKMGISDEEVRKILTKFEIGVAEEHGYIKKLVKEDTDKLGYR